MLNRALRGGLAATLIAGTAVLGATGVASAQPAKDDRCPANENSASGRGYNPPGQGAGVSNPNARRNEPQTARSGCARFKGPVQGTVNSTPLDLGTVQASPGGEAVFSFRIPSNFETGPHNVTMTGQAFDGSGQSSVVLPFTVVADAAAGATRGRSGALPRTGADSLVELTAAGVVLVGAGAGMVVVARRRRGDSPAGVA